jgi:nickel/cobalt tolerance cation efflux system protein
MFNFLIDWSSRNRLMVLALAVILVLFGGFKAADSDMDVLPEFSPPQVIVETDSPGTVAQEVETLISFPLETAINGTPGVTQVRSVSQTGISMVTVIFAYGTDIYTARQLINEKIQLVIPRLPKGTETPTMLPVMSAVADVLKIGMTSDRMSMMELRTLADWVVRNRLLAVPGVARVYVIGGDQKQYQVIVDPKNLRSFNVTLDAVRQAVQNANVVAPAGVMVSEDKQYAIRAVGRAQSVEDIANSVIVTRKGVPVLVRHVATVEIAPAFKVGDAVVDGEPGVELVVSRQPWCNTLDVTHRLEVALGEIQRGLPADVHMKILFRQANFIEKSISNVLWAIGLGGVLVVIVLLLFLVSWRTAIISLTAIPLSLLSAVLLIKLCGGSINTMTLGGLAIAVGEVVDDAIVDVENVYRRLRENKLRGNPKSTLRVIVDACKEVRSAVVYATFIVALVFLPVFFLSGTDGKIFSPLGYSYVIATLSSLLVALTVTPALCVWLLAKQSSISMEESRVLRTLKSTYAHLLEGVLRFPRVVLAVAILMFLGALSLLPLMGQEFLPEFQEENLIIAVSGLPGQSLSATTRMGTALEKELMHHINIAAVGQRAGRAQLDDDAGGPNFSEFDLQLKPSNHPLSAVIADVRSHLDEIPGISYDVGSFIQHRMEDVLSGGTRAQIAIKIFGSDMPTLRRLANTVSHELKGVRGAVDVRVEPLVLVPELSVKIDRLHASRYGVTAESLSRNLQTAFNGVVVSQVLDGDKLFDLKVWLDEKARANLDEIRNLLIDTADGSLIPLYQIADVRIEQVQNAVVRENVARRIVVQANTAGRDVVSVVNDAKKRLDSIGLPRGYYIVYAGEYSAQQEAAQRLLVASLGALVGILLLLRQGLHSWRSTLLVASNLPLATVGGIVAVALTGDVLSIGSLIGFISLFGISTRNSLLLVTHINALEDRGLSSREAIFHGALDRLGPVLMTAATAALGMLPLAIWGGSGRELEQPLAVVIVGGLVSSTVLTLVVIPALFMMFGSNRPSSLPLPESSTTKVAE